MNLLCPNCQKMLTVPEQYAGQLMKCPLCSGNFNRSRACRAARPWSRRRRFSSPPPPAPSPGANAPGSPMEPALPEGYGLKFEAGAGLPFAAAGSKNTGVQPRVAGAGLLPGHAFAGTCAGTCARAGPFARARRLPPRKPSSALPPAAGYSRTLTIWFSDRVLKWVAARRGSAALRAPVFSVGRCLSGRRFRPSPQSAWQAAFGRRHHGTPIWRAIYPGDSRKRDEEER